MHGVAAKELEKKEQLRLEWQARVDAQNVSAVEADRLSNEHVQLEKLYEQTRIRLDEIQKIMWEKEVQAEKHQSMVRTSLIFIMALMSHVHLYFLLSSLTKLFVHIMLWHTVLAFYHRPHLKLKDTTLSLYFIQTPRLQKK